MSTIYPKNNVRGDNPGQEMAVTVRRSYSTDQPEVPVTFVELIVTPRHLDDDDRCYYMSLDPSQTLKMAQALLQCHQRQVADLEKRLTMTNAAANKREE